MHVVELQFRSKSGGPAPADANDAVSNLIWALERNGQLVPDATRPDYEAADASCVIAFAPEATSLRPKLYSPRVRAALAALKRAGVAAPRCRVLGASPNSLVPCACREPSAMVLADISACELPTRCGDCDGTVPFYRFAHTGDFGEYDDIIFWIYHYRSFEAVWIHGGSGEKLAYAQLSRHDGELAREGRDVCRAIEKRAKVPVYYYLSRYYGRNLAAERRRRCPSCGGAWLLKEPWLQRYDFRCRKCRLVSCIASDLPPASRRKVSPFESPGASRCHLPFGFMDSQRA